jgi:ElaB/YqjD/DUF883 family membrane-anchored ribosome-binding protein
MNTEERGFTSQVLENEQIEQLEQAVEEKGKEMLSAASEWVRRNPYLAIGIALAAGVTIAALISKRD